MNSACDTLPSRFTSSVLKTCRSSSSVILKDGEKAFSPLNDCEKTFLPLNEDGEEVSAAAGISDMCEDEGSGATTPSGARREGADVKTTGNIDGLLSRPRASFPSSPLGKS